MSIPDLLAHYCAHAGQPAWQHELRQGARLHLALAEPGLDTHAVYAALRLVHDELSRQLVASHPASADSPAAAAVAAVVVQRGQAALLAQRGEREALRRELSVSEFAVVLRPTCRPPAMGWLLAA